MASKYRRANGKWTIKFKLHGKIRKMNLPHDDDRLAMKVKFIVERIVEFLEKDMPLDVSTLKWVYEQPNYLKVLFQRYGLSAATEQVSTLDDLIENYMRTLGGSAPGTKTNNRLAFDKLILRFGRDRQIGSITEGDAREFYHWLQQSGGVGEKPLAEASYSRAIKRVKTLFRYALDKDWVARNPFRNLKAGSQANPENFFDVTPEIAEQVLKELDQPSLQIIFALGRWGGLRLPSEAITLRWEWIDWKKNRFKVFTDKNKKHVFHRTRIVPIFPKLLPYLEAAFEDAEIGATFVCSYMHDCNLSSYRKRLITILKRLEIDVWPDLFKNLRSSRANEVERQFGTFCESAWIGHNEHTAKRHYFTPTEADFDRAINPHGIGLKRLIHADDFADQLASLNDEELLLLEKAVQVTIRR